MEVRCGEQSVAVSGCASSAEELSSSLTDEADLQITYLCIAPLVGRFAKSQKAGVGQSDPVSWNRGEMDRI